MPVIVLTKVDLCDDVDTKLLEIENIAIGVPIIETSIVDEAGLSQIYQYLKEYHTVAFVGSSGVGKSSLINHVLGTDQLETGGLRNDDKGRHTTTHRELFMISGKGMVIDTPGMRELGMWSAQDGIDHTFSDIEELVGKCRFSDCSHGNESGCAVRQRFYWIILWKKQKSLDAEQYALKEILIFMEKADLNRQASLASAIMDCRKARMHLSFCAKN